MSGELTAAVERINKGLERFADLGLERILVGRQGPGIMIDDLYLVLAALQAPCVGKGVSMEYLGAIIADNVEIVDVLGEQEIMGSTEAARIIFELISVQPVLDGQIRGGSGPQEAPSRGSPTDSRPSLDSIARAACAERCAAVGDPPCYTLYGVDWDGGKCDNLHDCDCASIARAVLREIAPDSQTSGGER